MPNQEKISPVEQIRRLLSSLEAPAPAQNGLKIGIGITEHNRYPMFKRCYDEVLKYAPSGAEIVVVDDASAVPVPEATYRFSTNVGIAVAKNKCLSLLYQRGCDHIFLLDSDTWPLTKDAWWPYVNSPEPHLMYIFKDFATGRKLNDTITIYQDSYISAYSHPRGCMLYYHRLVLDAVGGMDPVFGKWGYEHPSHSDRIFMSGLTSFRYMDVANNKGLWYSDDEQCDNKNTSVKGVERAQQIARNKQLYIDRKFSREFIPFLDKRNILLTCYFTRVKDTQNGRSWDGDSLALQPLIASLKDTKLVVLHDCLPDKDTDKVQFIRVDTSINPYFQRWVSYRQYLLSHKYEIDKVFCIDGTDVEILRDPDWDGMGNWIYTGDEPTKLDDAGGWMKKNHQSPAIKEFIEKYGSKYQLLNAGILGGKLESVCEFMRAIMDYYAISENDSYYHKWPNEGFSDMGTFNYIARAVFGNKIRYGREVCTVFKANERNDYSWFKHK